MRTFRAHAQIAVPATISVFLAPAIATSPDLGKTPQVLLLHRVDLPEGRVADYVSIESEIANAYRDAAKAPAINESLYRSAPIANPIRGTINDPDQKGRK